MSQLRKIKASKATQWFKNGDHPQDYVKSNIGMKNGELVEFTGAERKANKWEGSVVRYFRTPYVCGKAECKQCGKTMHDHGWIDNRNGGHIVCPGDWVITDANGEHSPCKPEVFQETYEVTQ